LEPELPEPSTVKKDGEKDQKESGQELLEFLPAFLAIFAVSLG
jgi:hypothetical protein